MHVDFRKNKAEKLLQLRKDKKETVNFALPPKV
jgi:hypothetical protein